MKNLQETLAKMRKEGNGLTLTQEQMIILAVSEDTAALENLILIRENEARQFLARAIAAELRLK
mgnify:CR=1 FL=1